MTRKFSFIIALMLLLVLSSNSHAITISADKSTDLGILASGSSLSINLKASNYTAAASKIRWTRKVESGRNPGFDFNERRGDSVIFSAPSLAQPVRGEGKFAITITAHDSIHSEASMTFTGTIMNKPLIKTEDIAKIQAGGKKYLQRFELAKGTEPINWEISGDLPPSIQFTTSTFRNKLYHVLSGEIQEVGEFPFTLIASNTVGYDAREYVLRTEAVNPRIRLPENFALDYSVLNGQEFSLDLSRLRITGTKPITLDIDEASKLAGLNYDAEHKIIAGIISLEPGTKRLHVNLTASNKYTQPSSMDFVLTLRNPPSGIKPVGKLWQKDSEDVIYVLAVNGRDFSAHFNIEGGSRPVTWEFFRADDNTSINNFAGLSFGTDGYIKGNPLGNEDLKFYVVASNNAGSFKSEVYKIAFAGTPNLDKARITAPFTILNGQHFNLNFKDYLTYGEHEISPVKFSLTGKLPAGLSFDKDSISGVLNITSPDEMKRYFFSVTASNQFGTSRRGITIIPKDKPKIDDIDEANLITRVGRKYRLKIPTQTKKPYTWKLLYNGEIVDEESEHEIGDSGLLWDALGGTVYSLFNTLNDGSYPVTVYLSNDVGVDTKTFTIQIRP